MINSHDEYEISKKAKKLLLDSSERKTIMLFYQTMSRKFKLKKRTMFLSGYIYDKYNELSGSNFKLSRNEQLNVIQACLLIAMKYEEIYPPFLKNWGNNPE